jgi:hypothetical protein
MMTRRMLVLAVGVSAACGGGGGGSGGPVITLSSDEVNQTSLVDGACPAHAVEVWIDDPGADYVGADFLTSPYAGWLQIALVEAGDHYLLALQANCWDLGPGLYSATFQVGTVDARGHVRGYRDVHFRLQMAAFSVEPATLRIGGADGLSQDPQQLRITVDPGGAAQSPYAIALSTEDGDWLRADPATGAAGRTGATVTVGADLAGVAPATHRGTARVTITLGGEPFSKDVPVTLNLEETRLNVSATGVAFLASPGRSVLSRDLQVLSANARVLTWTAGSDQPWLHVTPSGETGQTLHLSADPTGLVPGQTHLATVRLASDDPAVANQLAIRVGLHVLDADPPAVSVRNVPFGAMAASPVEPVVFLSGGGTEVIGLDVFSGQQIRTFAGVAEAARGLAMSGDGRYLFVFDERDDSWQTGTAALVQLDAATGDVVRRYPLSVNFFDPEATPLVVRPGGEEAVFAPGGSGFEVETGRPVSGLETAGGNRVGVGISPDQRLLATYGVLRIRHTALEGGPIVVEPFGGYFYGGCFTTDSGAVLTNAWFGGGYGFRLQDLASGNDRWGRQANDYTEGAACLWNGLLLAGLSGWYPENVWVLDERTGANLGSLSSTERTSHRHLPPWGLAASADGTRAITVAGPEQYPTEQTEIRFQTLPVPP